MLRMSLHADTRLLRANKCLLCTLRARSILKGEYKWRKFIAGNCSDDIADKT